MCIYYDLETRIVDAPNKNGLLFVFLKNKYSHYQVYQQIYTTHGRRYYIIGDLYKCELSNSMPINSKYYSPQQQSKPNKSTK